MRPKSLQAHRKSLTATAHSSSGAMWGLDQQLMRILRCTAQAMVSSPGGLRFVAGTQPWLEGLPGAKPHLAPCLARAQGQGAADKV